MSDLRKYIDLKYEDKKQTIEDILKTEKLPIVVRTCQFEGRTEHTEIPQDTEVLIQQASEETFAHIKVLKFYDNEERVEKQGAEYVLEHETFVGNEYFMPLRFGRLVKYARRPGSRERYLTIDQVVGDCPAFVRTENETNARLSRYSKQTAIIPAKTVLELKRVYKNETEDLYLECSDGNKTYFFSENNQVNFTAVEKTKLYSLAELSHTTLLPKVILFKDVSPEEIVLKDNELRSAMVTVTDGPIEVLGIGKVKYVTCWIRNRTLRTYETMLIPKDMWDKTYIQLRCFHSAEGKGNYLLQKYGPCLKSDFVGNYFYVFPLALDKSVWLRSPDFFKQKLEGNVFYDVIKVPYTYSSDEDDDVYSEIAEPRPPVPRRDKIGTSNTWKKTQNDKEIKTTEVEKKEPTNTTAHTRNVKTAQKIDKKEAVFKIQHTPQTPPLSSGNDTSTKDEEAYTLLEFAKAERVYDTLDIYSDSAPKLVPLGYTDNPVDKADQYVELSQVRKVLDDKQSKEHFFNYSVKEVSFCFEHCGLKALADMCYARKLDGSFFKGFDDWEELNLSKLDVIILKKVIYEGWRSKDDSKYNATTNM